MTSSLLLLLRAAASEVPECRPSAREVGAKAEALLKLLGGDPRRDAGSPDYGATKASFFEPPVLILASRFKAAFT